MFAGGSEEGSRNVFFDDLWRMSPTSEGNPWTRVAPSEPWPEARRGHWMAPVTGGFVVVGGRERNHNCFRDAWVYAAAADAWTRSAHMPPEADYPCRWGHTATRVPPLVAQCGELKIFYGTFVLNRRVVRSTRRTG